MSSKREFEKKIKKHISETKVERDELAKQNKQLLFRLDRVEKELESARAEHIKALTQLIEQVNISNELLEMNSLNELLTHPSERIREAAKKHKRFIKKA